jgi:hypothetical protein
MEVWVWLMECNGSRSDLYQLCGVVSVATFPRSELWKSEVAVCQ